MDSDSLFVVLGWDPSAGPFVEKLLCLGRHVVLVDLVRPAEVPQDVSFVAGDPEDPVVLGRAGVAGAAALLCCLPESSAGPALAEARRLNPRIRLAAVAGAEAAR